MGFPSVVASCCLLACIAGCDAGCDASAFQQNTDTRVKAYDKITTNDALACCAACSADSKCAFFSFDGTAKTKGKDNCHKKAGTMSGHTLPSVNFTTSALPPPPPPTPVPTHGPNWGSKPNVV